VYGVFFLHENDWEGLEILPVENRARCLAALHAWREQSGPGSGGWRKTDAFVLPDTQQDCRLADRHISIDDLQRLVGPNLPRAAIVEARSSSCVRIASEHFAFGEGYGDLGGLYGKQQDGIVHSLFAALPVSTDSGNLSLYATVLTTLGNTHDLFLLDWWRKAVVALRNAAHICTYLRENAEDS